MAKYSSEKQLISPNFGSGDNVAGNPGLKPTYGGITNGLPGDNLPKRTSSPAACNEKLTENVPGGPSKS